MVIRMDTKTETAHRVTAAIEAAGESKLSIAEKTGIPRTTLWRRLNGLTSFYMEELHLIARVLDVPVTDFVVTERAA